MSKFNKRGIERKGENKNRSKDMKLIEKNMDELVNPENLELPDEPSSEDTDTD